MIIKIMEQLRNNHGESLWSDDLERLINDQVNLEIVNMLTYESLGCHFRNCKQGYTKIASHFRLESDEELKHARSFMDYQTMRGGSVCIRTNEPKNIDVVKSSSTPCTEAYRLALQLEKDTYAHMLMIHSTANDPHLQDHLELCMSEQLEGQKELNDKIKLLESSVNRIGEYLHEINLD